jgi:trehalose 6-phosphate synthase/phosphatase
MRQYSMVVVANRLPVTVQRTHGRLVYQQSDGGLATALSSVNSDDMVWIGWPGIASDDLTPDEKKQITKELATRGCVPVFLSEKDIDLFYEGYSNDMLWPLFHYFQSYMINKDEYWHAYELVNRAYRDAVQKVAKPTATVWIHDYHLMLLPALVRSVLPEALIGYFHHVPFASYEIFRLLPQRKEILLGLLGADLIGFHIYDYARHFLSSTLRLLGVPNEYGTLHIDGRLVRVDSFPISIDYERFTAIHESEEAKARYESLLETYDGQRIIFSVDRLDYSKGIPERLEGYRRFLEDNPQFVGQVVLLMVVSPSRGGVDTYKQLQLQIEQTVSRINGEFGSAEWTPISYQFQTLSLEEIVPLFMAADTMLVTPRRDGMNLVAKEYVVSKGGLPGALILSEMTGAFEELPEALAVNPNDTLAIARAIKRSFDMSKKERKERMTTMQNRIQKHPVTKWSNDYLSALTKVRELQCEAAIVELKGSMLDALVDEFWSAKDRLLVFDYDGTLQTFKSSPNVSAATPSKHVYRLIDQLASLPRTRVCIVSGRSRDALETWFGDTKAQLTGEHGAWTKTGASWHKHAIDFEPARQAILPVLEEYTSRTPGSRIEQKDFSTVWHYRNVPIELAHVRAFNLVQELQMALGDDKVSVHVGNKIIEVKPDGISKKAAVQAKLIDQDADFVLVAGDDYTDEDMFDAAPDTAYSVKVGPGDTDARYRVASVAAMIQVLEKILSRQPT